MIGNDIIDLTLASKQSNWRRPRFLEKLFTTAEQAFIDSAEDQDMAVWLLWSGKESAYKIMARLLKRRFFTPKKFKHQEFSSDLSSSRLVFEEIQFQLKSSIKDACIHTTAVLIDLPDSSEFSQNSYPIRQDYPNTQSHDTREQLIEDYSLLKHLNKGDLTIKKDKLGIPNLFYKNQQLSATISLSHHGRFGGYAILNHT